MQSDIRERLQDALGGAYELQSELAPGGMSRLFVALERSLGRRVVVKVLPPELASDVSIARFQREIALTAHLQHPHILTILSTGASGGLLYYIAPYVDGESLRHRLTRQGALPLHDALRLLRDVADALAYAHAHGVIHRDIKPENILLQADHALLADFGIARAVDNATKGQRLTETGMGIGTPQYMAPEQMLAGDIEPDARADIYALGTVAYEVLTGSPPFLGRTPREGVVAQFTQPAPPVTRTRSEVPVAVSNTIASALLFDPEKRLRTASAFRDAMSVDVHAVSTLPFGSRSFKSRATLLAVALATIAVVATYATRTTFRAHVPPGATDEAAAGDANAIAVLPFTNLTPAADNQFFSDGMTEELITALSRVNGLHVVARTSAFAFRGSKATLQDISTTLHVGAVVEGSVRRSQKHLRVSARLVDSRSGYEMWSEDYDRDLEDVFAVQDDIARAIAGAIAKKLDGTLSKRTRVWSDSVSHTLASGHLVRRSTNNMEAYDLYLRAKEMREQRGEGGLRGAISLLTRAIAKDSGFADAYAALALTYDILPDYTIISDDSVNPLIAANANHALRLDSTSVEAEIALAGLAASQWQWSKAEAHDRRAIALDSSNAQAHEHFAVLLRTEGKFEASIHEHREAAALDPLSPPVTWNLGITEWNARKYRDAVHTAERAIQLAPNLPNAYLVLAMARASSDQGDSAAHVADQLRVRFPKGYTLAFEAWVYAKSGRRKEAEAALERLRHERLGVEISSLEMAMAHIGLGNTDSALTWIEKSVRDHESEWSGDMSLCGALFDDIRTEPRFRAATGALGISNCAPTTLR